MDVSFGAPARVVAALCAAYFISHFYRSSVAVIAPELSRDIGLSAESLGVLTGAFFLAFAAAQIPLGVMFDRFGPRRTIALVLGFAVVGSLIFAAAGSAAFLTLGRALMGIGCASVFMGSVVVCSRWYPPDRLATAAAIVLAVGGTGGLLATTPLAWAAETVGWRGSFMGMAAVTAAVCVLVFALVRDAPPGHPFLNRKPPSLAAIWKGLRAVLADRRLPYILAMNFISYPAVATVLALWAGPYLNDVHGLDPVARGNVLLVAATAMIFGPVCYGPLDRVFDSRKRVVLCGGLATVAVLGLLAVVPSLGLWPASMLLVALGGIGVYGVLIVAHSRSLFPESLVGRVVTVVNTANFAGVATMQMASGWILGAFPDRDGISPEAAYRTVFGFLALCLLLALAIYSRVPDAKPSEGIPVESRVE